MSLLRSRLITTKCTARMLFIQHRQLLDKMSFHNLLGAIFIAESTNLGAGFTPALRLPLVPNSTIKSRHTLGTYLVPGPTSRWWGGWGRHIGFLFANEGLRIPRSPAGDRMWSHWDRFLLFAFYASPTPSRRRRHSPGRVAR